MTENFAAARTGRLMVYVGGLAEKPANAEELFTRLQREPGHIEDIWWGYPNRVRPLTRGSLAILADTLNQRIQALWTKHGRPDEIVLIGHSAGGVLLRYAYLCGRGRLGGHRATWVDQVNRIVLLAAPNRGIEPSRLPWPTRIASIVAASTFRKFAALELLAGAAFMTNLRLEWIRVFSELGNAAPLVVQVRGAADPLVHPEDSRDIEGRPTGADLYIPLATHRDIVKVSAVPEDSPGQRYSILRQAIIGAVEITEPQPLPEQERAVTDIVFLLHGIRAGIKTWMPDLRDELENGATGQMLVVTDRYGWLSAFNFAFPVSRRRTLRWFQDQYSYRVARHPNARIHFVGHSNGTYMFGQSLRQVRTLQFHRVYLAGSVLPRQFPWRGLADGQIGTLVNACGVKDKPVGWLCSGLRGLGMSDIGTGGFDGFEGRPPGTVEVHLDGTHGAGLTAQRLPGVARYIRDAELPGRETSTPSWLFAQVSRLAPYLLWLLALGFLGVVAWTVIAFSPFKLGALLLGLAVIYVGLKVM